MTGLDSTAHLVGSRPRAERMAVSGKGSGSHGASPPPPPPPAEMELVGRAPGTPLPGVCNCTSAIQCILPQTLPAGLQQPLPHSPPQAGYHLPRRCDATRAPVSIAYDAHHECDATRLRGSPGFAGVLRGSPGFSGVPRGSPGFAGVRWGSPGFPGPESSQLCCT